MDTAKNRLPLPPRGNKLAPVHVLVRILRSRRFIAGCCALLLCGCSTFNRDWQRAAAQPAPPDSIAGRWEGRWVSEANGHSGDLRCLMTPATNDVYHARFRATYARVLKFGYTVPLAVQPHFDGWEFNGEANLGKLAGGIYYYEGRASLTNFTSTYRSKYDHGVFELARPK